MELNNSSEKKHSLEDLSKEDILIKYKNLLIIAQKAKQSKSTLQEENAHLKKLLAEQEKTQSNHTFEEVLEKLTQQKLDLVTSVEDLNIKNRFLSDNLNKCNDDNSLLAEKINRYENENISYQRQIKRLTVENEQLLKDLDALENQIQELNRIGVEQNRQLLILEKNSKFINSNESNDSTSPDFDKILITKDEVILKLQRENEELSEKALTLESLLKHQSEERLLENEIVLKLKGRLKLYHSKIVKFASMVKNLREDKNVILEQFRNYTDQVQEWKEKLNKASERLLNLVNELEKENVNLKKTNQHLKDINAKIVEQLEARKTDDEKSKDMEQIEELKVENVKLVEEIGTLKNMVQKKDEENFTVNEKLSRFLEEIENHKLEAIKIQEFSGKIEDLSLENLKLIDEIQNLKGVIEEKNEENSIVNIKLHKILEEIDNYKLKATKEQEFSEKIKELNVENSKLVDIVNSLNGKIVEMNEENLIVNEKLDTSLKKIKDDKLEALKDEDSLWKMEQLGVENLKLFEEVNTLKREVELKNEENSVVNEKLSKILKEFEDYKSKVMKKQQESSEKLENLGVKNLQLLEEVNALKGEVELKNEANSAVNEKLSEVLKEIEDYKVKEMEKQQASSEKLEDLIVKNLKLLEEVNALKGEVEVKNEENFTINKKLAKLLNEIEDHKIEVKAQEEVLGKIDLYKTQVDELNKKVNVLETELEHSKATEKQLAERSGEEIIKLVDEIKEISENNVILQEKLYYFENNKKETCNMDIQTGDDLAPSNELEEKVENLKRENSQLLSEMNEMNQELKERGENVSKLQAHCEEVMKKLQIYETQANKNVNSITEKEEYINELKQEISALKIVNKNVSPDLKDKEKEISSLKEEIEMYKDKISNNSYNFMPDNDGMSTSTISKTEELNQLKDLESSWEERYGKLRNLAVKLKAKIKEINGDLVKEKSEKGELQQSLNKSIENSRSVEVAKKQLENDIEKVIKKLTNKEKLASDLSLELEEMKKEKANLENWKKQIASKVQSLRKELDEKNALREELQTKVSQLSSDLEVKEQALKSEIENHQQTKNSLQHSNNENKKNSVLNLEMQDYEKSVKELSQKLDKKQEHINKLKGQIDSQKTVTNSMRDQVKNLEEKVLSRENEYSTALNEISLFKKKINDLENAVITKEENVYSLTQQLEAARSQNEELSTELSKDITEHRKYATALKEERENDRSLNFTLQQNLKELRQKLQFKNDELNLIQNEYENYKVRAQSVLRQNHNRDVSLEEKLSEDVTSLKSRIDALNFELKELKNNHETLEKENEILKIDNKKIASKSEESSNELGNVRQEYKQLLSKYNQTIQEHNETVRTLKVHADTLSQCYRQQLAEQESRLNKEIIELQNKIHRSSPIEHTPPVLPAMMPREEGEGSESVETNSMTNIIHPVPLERLLQGDEDQQVDYMKGQLNKQEAKLNHLTELLADTEQDLAKHVQMNKVLKEEIRRQQRAVEREKHAENLEYLKNVVFKFVTLSNGDERTRLVPVLNTILKLSPDETQKLNLVAKGDPSFKGWSNYLPGWSSNKS